MAISEKDISARDTSNIEALRVIREYLEKHKMNNKLFVKTTYDDCIISMQEALSHVSTLLKANKNLVMIQDLISKEALKQGMILHFDKGSSLHIIKKIS